ncbi:MAG: flagellar FliJ family protein [Ignavibacteriales bacterium]|nr:flagellar FliJ family protein [Ignavibacteriales bacterium]
MQKFKFKYDAVIRVKEILEKKVLKEISLLDTAIEKLNDHKKSLEEKRKQLGVNAHGVKIKVLEYKSIKTLITSLEKEIFAIEKKIEDLKLKKEEKKQELYARKKEVKILETLKENQYQEFLSNSNREELKQLNEIAINNFRKVS